jgi:hypothetical protein
MDNMPLTKSLDQGKRFLGIRKQLHQIDADCAVNQPIIDTLRVRLGIPLGKTL